MHVLRGSVQGDAEAKGWQVGIQKGKDLQGNSGKSFRPQLERFRAQSATWRNPLSHRRWTAEASCGLDHEERGCC